MKKAFLLGLSILIAINFYVGSVSAFSISHNTAYTDIPLVYEANIVKDPDVKVDLAVEVNLKKPSSISNITFVLGHLQSHGAPSNINITVCDGGISGLNPDSVHVNCRRLLTRTIKESDSLHPNFKSYEISVETKDLESYTFIIKVEYTIPNFVIRQSKYHILSFSPVCYPNNMCGTWLRDVFLPQKSSVIEKIDDTAKLDRWSNKWYVQMDGNKNGFVWYSDYMETDWLLPFFWAFIGAVLGAFVIPWIWNKFGQRDRTFFKGTADLTMFSIIAVALVFAGLGVYYIYFDPNESAANFYAIISSAIIAGIILFKMDEMIQEANWKHEKRINENKIIYLPLHQYIQHITEDLNNYETIIGRGGLWSSIRNSIDGHALRTKNEKVFNDLETFHNKLESDWNNHEPYYVDIISRLLDAILRKNWMVWRKPGVTPEEPTADIRSKIEAFTQQGFMFRAIMKFNSIKEASKDKWENEEKLHSQLKRDFDNAGFTVKDNDLDNIFDTIRNSTELVTIRSKKSELVDMAAKLEKNLRSIILE